MHTRPTPRPQTVILTTDARRPSICGRCGETLGLAPSGTPHTLSTADPVCRYTETGQPISHAPMRLTRRQAAAHIRTRAPRR